MSNTTPAARPRLRVPWLAKLALSAGVLTFLLYSVEIRAVIEVLRTVRPNLVVLALAMYLAGQLISAGKWALLAGSLGFRQPYRAYAAFYFMGMFVNLLGPSTVGGDLTRGLYLGGSGHRTLALASVAFDRASGFVVLVTIGLVALLVFPGYALPPILTGVTAVLVACLLISWWILPRAVALVLPERHALRRVVTRELAPFWRNRLLLAKIALVSAGFHLVEVTIQYTLARSLGISLPFAYCLILHPAVTVLAAIPVSVAGLGVREGGYVVFLELVGVPRAAALTFSLLWFATAVVGALPGGVLWLLRGLGGREIAASTASGGGAAADRPESDSARG